MQVMFGVLLAIRGSLHHLHVPSGSGGGQDKHMVLPLAPVIGRIPNLPTSTKPVQHIHKVKDVDCVICM